MTAADWSGTEHTCTEDCHADMSCPQCGEHCKNNLFIADDITLDMFLDQDEFHCISCGCVFAA